MTGQKAKILVAIRREGRFSVAGDRSGEGRGRRMVRAVIMGIALLAAAGLAVTPALAQSGFDRPGGDYSSASVPNGDPAVCAARCEHEARCRAWSFSYPPASGGPAMCWLKRDVVPRVEASCCVSGVRGAGVIEPRAG